MCLLLLAAAPLLASAQTTEQVPSAPSTTSAQAAAPQFPPTDPRNFTAATPSVDTVNAFLKAQWGYDPDRIWQVQAIQKTDAAGISKVTVLAAQKGSSQQTGSLIFFTTADGEHLIANEVLPFGAHPFDAHRKLLQAAANGPAEGPASKSMLLVEFSDFECPHCKEALPTIQKLVADFPQARFVYENFPLVSIHSEAYKAAAYGVCVQKEKGDAAFFTFADAIFANQAGLTPAGSTEALNAAAAKAGATGAAACSTSAAAKSTVDASIRLAEDLGVNQTPTLFINGRGIPVGGLSYEELKKIVAYQFESDK
jgi:protein-disulfide isomerase